MHLIGVLDLTLVCDILRQFLQAKALFLAALHYAPPGRISASARLVAACSQHSGLFDDALSYLELAERHSGPGGEWRANVTVLKRLVLIKI